MALDRADPFDGFGDGLRTGGAFALRRDDQLVLALGVLGDLGGGARELLHGCGHFAGRRGLLRRARGEQGRSALDAFGGSRHRVRVRLQLLHPGGEPGDGARDALGEVEVEGARQLAGANEVAVPELAKNADEARAESMSWVAPARGDLERQEERGATGGDEVKDHLQIGCVRSAAGDGEQPAAREPDAGEEQRRRDERYRLVPLARRPAHPTQRRVVVDPLRDSTVTPSKMTHRHPERPRMQDRSAVAVRPETVRGDLRDRSRNG
jgi:hypothetical protein